MGSQSGSGRPRSGSRSGSRGGGGSRSGSRSGSRPRSGSRSGQGGRSRRGGSSGGVGDTVMKWTNVVACCFMALALLIVLFALSHSVGRFVVLLFEMAWMLLQAFEGFDFADLQAWTDRMVPFMRNGVFRGSLLLVFGLWHISYADWAYWISIFQSIGGILLLVAGVINIVIGALQMAGKM